MLAQHLEVAACEALSEVTSTSINIIQAKKREALTLVQTNRLAEAKTLYAEICRLDKGDVEAWFMQGAINGQLQSYGEAEACFRRVIALHPQHAEAHDNLGVALQYQGKLKAAVEHYREAVRIKPEYAGAYFNLGNVLKEQGNLEEAVSCFRGAIRLQPGHIEARNNLGTVLREQGKLTQSVTTLQQAIEINRNVPELFNNLGTALQRLDNTEQAIASIRQALRIKPDYAEAHDNLGNVLLAQKKFTEALACFEQAIKIKPDYAGALAHLADAYEKSNQLDQAARLAGEALGHDSKNITATLILSKLDRRAGNLDTARGRIERLFRASPDAVNCGELSVELGHIQDRLGDHGAAFKAFDAGQKAIARADGAVEFDKIAYLEGIARMRSWFTSANVADWKVGSPADDEPEPVFLVGFQRSGTTLSEQILGSHSQIVTSDELPIIRKLVTQTLPALTGNASFPECLTELTPSDIHRLRGDYWEMARESVGNEIGAKVFVDKFPFNILQLGFINRVFPRAKILVGLRDPRDVCLSCFMQTFKLNQGNVFFTDIEDTARLYAAVMDLWLQYRAALPLNYLEYRYEDLVSDFEPTTRRLLQFIGAEWEDVVLHYYRPEQRRYVSTPSYEGVMSPIYARSVSRWSNYQEQIRPILDTLEPFIKAFSYN